MSSREVVVTGVGVLTGYGRGLSVLSRGLHSNQGATAPLVAFDPAGLPIGEAAEFPEPLAEVPGLPDDRKGWLALEAVQDALRSAGLNEAPEAGVYLGTGLSSVTPSELEVDVLAHLGDQGLDHDAVMRDVDPRRAAPRRHLPERVTAAVADIAGARGPQYTSFSACAAGAQAIAEGARAVRRGDLEVALCGGHDSMIHPLGVLSFVVLGALAAGPCRPFDRRRDGFVIGEGAAVLVLESADSARRRGARPMARVLGSGTSVDAFQPTAPHAEGRGAILAMNRSLKDSGLSPSQISHVNAHGTGTPIGDAIEARAIAAVLGSEVPVSSIKGAVGHCIAAAGAVEAAACVAALDEGWSPGTLGLEQPEDWPVQVRPEPLEDAPETILSNSFGFGGQNCALVFGRA
ncbi:MAG: beta-ketoacyl-[acyl-carrier-protein] synthase family protein [Myxococcota bacterium]|nr:beta-ketoacyl-[acyl-carrier-protein] synthase family protein [Myxococcota bacterium]